MPMVALLTSSYWSQLRAPIAMALLGGLSKMGEHVFFPMADGRVIEAEICDPVFFDRKESVEWLICFLA